MENAILSIVKESARVNNSTTDTTTNASVLSQELGIAMVEQLKEESDQAKQAITDSTRMREVFAPEIIKLKSVETRATNAVTLMDKRQALAVGVEKRRIAAEAGTIDAMSALTTQLVKATKEASAKRGEFLELRNRTIGNDGGLGWLEAQLVMSSTESELKAADAAVSDIGKSISTLRLATTDTATAVDSIAVKLSEAEIAEIDKGFIAALQAKELESELTGKEATATAIKNSFALTLEQIRASSGISAAVTNERNANAASAARALEDKNYKEISRIVNIALADSQQLLSTPESIKASATVGGESWLRAQALFAKGINNQDPDNLSAAVGNSTGDAFAADILIGHETLKIDNGVNRAAQAWSIQARRDYEKATGVVGSFAEASKEQRLQAINQASETYVKEQRENIKVGGDNMFSMLSMEALAKTKAVEEIRLWTEVIQPSKMTGVNEQELVNLVGQSIMDEVFTIEQASEGLYDIMQASRAALVGLNQYERRHIANPTSYPIDLSVKLGGFLGFLPDTAATAIEANLYDKNSIKSLLISYIAERRTTFKGSRSVLDFSKVNRSTGINN